VVYPNTDIGAAVSSGSFRTEGMVVAPCSIRTVSEIAHGTTTSLLTRAADVVLKERQRLVLMVRESPLHTGHLRTLTLASEIGAVIAPPVPGFYANAEALDHPTRLVLERDRIRRKRSRRLRRRRRIGLAGSGR